jgi:quinol-cytochrome oxidoreductase complex cytochrome b subunit
LAKWHSINVTGVLPVVAASSSQSATNTTELLAAIQGQHNSTDKLQQAVFRSLHVQVPTISEINKISITQQQQKQGITPQELQNALKISFDNLSLKQKGTLTQPKKPCWPKQYITLFILAFHSIFYFYFFMT